MSVEINDFSCLFRGGKEKAIRTKMLEGDLIECVILLPEKLFYNPGAPGAIIILNKNKSTENKNKILFINPSSKFMQHPEVRKLNVLGEEHIRQIARVEFKTGKLLLILPKDHKNPDIIIEKHKAWIFTQKSLILSALNDAEHKNLDL
ncbi:MAG: SAM-dependent methyltransferase [ANME-2 cluster archaeon]|nr:SAM-dependent methyltransferase [ANME-2 cluster archaeon]